MIAIFDNGGQYSDHRIWFIDVGEDKELAGKRIKVLTQGEWFLLATGEGNLVWREPSAITPFEYFLVEGWPSCYLHADSCDGRYGTMDECTCLGKGAR